MKLEIELETETVMDKIKGGKTYLTNGTFSNNTEELLDDACDKCSNVMYEEAN